MVKRCPVLHFFKIIDNEFWYQCSTIGCWYLILNILSGCNVSYGDDSQEMFDACIIATHAPDTLRILGSQATSEEVRVLGAFQYAYRYIIISSPLYC